MDGPFINELHNCEWTGIIYKLSKIHASTTTINAVQSDDMSALERLHELCGSAVYRGSVVWSEERRE